MMSVDFIFFCLLQALIFPLKKYTMLFIPLLIIKVRFAQDGTYPRKSFAITNGNVNSTKVAPIAKQTIGSFLCLILVLTILFLEFA